MVDDQVAWFIDWLEQQGIEVPEATAAAFGTFLDTLLEWNRRTNLISHRDEIHLADRHLCESAMPLLLMEIPTAAEVLDLGAGAGFPGLVWKILRPDLCMSLLDSQRRRVLFLRDVVRRLRLEQTDVVRARAEELAGDSAFRERYTWVTARAVAPLDRLWRWSRPLLCPGGRLLAFKGGELSGELDRLRQFSDLTITVRPFPDIPPFSGRDRKLVIVQREGST